MLLRKGEYYSESDYCLENVSRGADVLVRKGSSSTYLDSCKLFKIGDGGKSKEVESRFGMLRDFAPFDITCYKRQTK